MSDKMFEGLKVLDMSMNIAAPCAAATLGDFGADVIKVERPVVGDVTRSVYPMIDGFSYSSWWFNRSKRSITVDLKDPEGIALIKSMIPKMDILLESFRPGTMDKLGLGYDVVKELNPRIIYVSVSMYGLTGPDRMLPGYDLLAQARAGHMDISGEKGGDPVKSGFYLSDYVCSTFTYSAITSALYYRDHTGKGQHCDVALLDCLFSYNSNFELGCLGVYPTRQGNHATQYAPYGVFEGSHKEFVAIASGYDKDWAILCRMMGREDAITDPDTCSPAIRVQHLDKVIDIIESWLKSFDDIRIPTKMMIDAGLSASLIYSTKDLQNDEQLIARKMIIPMETPTGVTSVKNYHMRGQPLKFSEVEAEPYKACAIGEHSIEILKEYGYTQEAAEALEKKWTDDYYKGKK